MPKITALKAQKKIKDRVNVYLDGKYSFSLDIQSLMENDLAVGAEVSEADLATLILDSQRGIVIAKILNFLSYRPRSQKEIRDRLYKYTKDFGDHQAALIESVESYLSRHNLFDDYEFARWFIGQRQAHRPRSMGMLRAELSAKGVPRDIIASVLAESEYDPQVALAKILDKKLKGVSSVKDDNARRLIVSLQRQGFPYSEIKLALEKALNDESES